MPEPDEEAPVTEAELARARSFLVDRLLPDLDAARKSCQTVQQERKRYEQLQIHLRDRDEAFRKEKPAPSAQAELSGFPGVWVPVTQ